MLPASSLLTISGEALEPEKLGRRPQELLPASLARGHEVRRQGLLVHPPPDRVLRATEVIRKIGNGERGVGRHGLKSYRNTIELRSLRRNEDQETLALSERSSRSECCEAKRSSTGGLFPEKV